MVVSLIHANCKHEIRYTVVAISPRRGWVLPERQLLTEGRLLNFENIFAALLQQGLKVEKPSIALDLPPQPRSSATSFV